MVAAKSTRIILLNLYRCAADAGTRIYDSTQNADGEGDSDGTTITILR